MLYKLILVIQSRFENGFMQPKYICWKGDFDTPSSFSDSMIGLLQGMQPQMGIFTKSFPLVHF